MHATLGIFSLYMIEEAQLKIIQIVLENVRKKSRLLNICLSVAQGSFESPYPCSFSLPVL